MILMIYVIDNYVLQSVRVNFLSIMTIYRQLSPNVLHSKHLISTHANQRLLSWSSANYICIIYVYIWKQKICEIYVTTVLHTSRTWDLHQVWSGEVMFHVWSHEMTAMGPAQCKLRSEPGRKVDRCFTLQSRVGFTCLEVSDTCFSKCICITTNVEGVEFQI